MRVPLAIGALLLVAGCAGPRSNGALWALQNAQEDTVLFRTSDAARAAQAHGYELSLADADLANEQTRVAALLAECPTPERQPPDISVGDRVRDGIRVRIGDDAQRRATLSAIALADWYARRGECDRAQAALNGQLPLAQRSPLIEALGEATVSRGPAKPFVGDPVVALGLYASGAVDAVTAGGPLPYYLAATYGGTVSKSQNREDAAAQVDAVAPAYPDWEPDALLAALR